MLNIYINRQSPNEYILCSSWFNGAKEEIKRQHRIKYLIQKGLSNEILEEILESCALDIERLTTEFNKLFDKLNKFTHINEKSYNMPHDEAQLYLNSLIKSFINFFNMAKELERQLQSTLSGYIEDHLHEEIMNDTIGEIDECSTHHTIEATYINQITVTGIDAENIYFKGDGTITVEQQYGSDSDLRNDNGMITNSDFPVEFSGKINCSNFEIVNIDPYLEVNNDFHYGIERIKSSRKNNLTIQFFRKIKLKKLIAIFKLKARESNDLSDEILLDF